jgi:hypothetical protein
VNLYKLVVLEYYDDEQQIKIILMNINLGVVDHLVVWLILNLVIEIPTMYL